MNVVVVGGGAWGTAFTHLLRGRGHEATDAEETPPIQGQASDTVTIAWGTWT